MSSKQVCARLNEDEYAALSEVPGEKDADKVRRIVRSRSIAHAISEPIVTELGQMHERMQALETKVDYQRDEIRALRKRLDNEPILLPENASSIIEKLGKAIPMMAKTIGEIETIIKGNKQ